MSQRVFETQTGIQLLDSRFIKKFQEHTDSYHPPSQLPGFWIQNSGHSTFVSYQPYHFKSLAINQRESLWEMRKMQRTCPRSDSEVHLRRCSLVERFLALWNSSNWNGLESYLQAEHQVFGEPLAVNSSASHLNDQGDIKWISQRSQLERSVYYEEAHQPPPV